LCIDPATASPRWAVARLSREWLCTMVRFRVTRRARDRRIVTSLAYLGKIPAAVYALLGVLLGGWITRAIQHKQWVFENRKQEYRELLDGLFQASEEIIKARPNIGSGLNDALANAIWKGTRVVRSRIFIARLIRDEGIHEDWQTIVSLALWEPEEEKLKIKGKEYAYTTSAIIILRNDLEEKLLGIVQKDLSL
jgi:hypothetical protein